MALVISYFLFLVLLFVSVRLFFTKEGITTSPYNPLERMKCSGLELFLIFVFTTGLLGIMPLLAVRLGLLEAFCIAGIIMCKNKTIISFPIVLFILFVLWTVIGLAYTPTVSYGFRMVLKYAAPLLVCLLASTVVRDGEILLKAMIRARNFCVIALLVFIVPFLNVLFGISFWHSAAVVTHCISLAMFSLALFFFSDEKKKNLIWFLALCFPCFWFVIRTDIMGTMVALSTFSLIRYRIKAIPVLCVIGCLSLASMFYIPNVKAKMYFRPDEVSLTDFLTGNVDENNINTSGRKNVWEEATVIYEQNDPLIGSGTGTIQEYLYAKYNYGAQLHGDFLVMLVDNGLIGLILFLAMYLAVVAHCIIIYRKNNDPLIQLSALSAGASLVGVMVTMYSDNTISFSLATLAYPWGLYGMVLGILEKQKQIYG